MYKKYFCTLILFFYSVFCYSQKNISIEVENGVPETAKLLVKTTIDKSLKFIKDELGLDLLNEVKILLVPDDNAYIQAQVRENKVSQIEAERRARTTKGWSKGNLIIQNIGGLPEDKMRIFNLSHEIFHQLQSQLCGSNANKIMWIFEGSADVFGAQIVELCDLQTLQQYENNWINILKKANEIPALDELYSSTDWYSSLDKYPNSLSYRVSGLALLKLIKEKSFRSVGLYFAALDEMDPSLSFENNFDMELTEFEEEYNSNLETYFNQ